MLFFSHPAPKIVGRPLIPGKDTEISEYPAPLGVRRVIFKKRMAGGPSSYREYVNSDYSPYTAVSTCTLAV